MKIALITTWEQRCGIATYSKDLARALRDLGHEVRIFAEQTDSAVGETNEFEADRCWRRQGGIISALGALRDWKPDAIHIQHEFGLFPNTRDFLDFIGYADDVAATFVTLHTVESDGPLAGINRHLHRKCDVIAHTPIAAAVCNGHYIPHGIVQVDPVETTYQPIILVPGFINAGKGQEEILFSYIESEAKQRLVIAGQCRDPDLLHRLNVIATHTTKPVTIINNFLPAEKMTELFSAADFVILGGRDHTPLSASGQFARAIGHGVPVLAKNTAIYRHHGGAAMLYGEMGEVRDSVDKTLIHALNNQSWVEDYLPEVKRVVKERSWENVAKNHVSVYSAGVR